MVALRLHSHDWRARPLLPEVLGYETTSPTPKLLPLLRRSASVPTSLRDLARVVEGSVTQTSAMVISAGSVSEDGLQSVCANMGAASTKQTA